MNQQEFVLGVRSGVIEQNLMIYRELFGSADLSGASDPYWRSALEMYKDMAGGQKEVFFSVIRQIMVDTVSNLFGVLDGVSWLEGQDEGFVFKMKNGDKPLNEGLQDLFLEMEEMSRPPCPPAFPVR